MRLRRDQHCNHRRLARLDLRRDVEDAADKCAARRAHFRAVHPHFGRVVDAVEVQPHTMFLVGARHVDDGPVPVRGVAQAFRNDLGPVVFAVERLWINMIVDQRSEHRARHRGRIPAPRVETRACHLRARLRRFGHILQLPAAIDRDWLRYRRGRCRQRRKRGRNRNQGENKNMGSATTESSTEYSLGFGVAKHCVGNAYPSFSDRAGFCSEPESAGHNEIMQFQRSSGVLLHISSLPSVGGIGDHGPGSTRVSRLSCSAPSSTFGRCCRCAQRDMAIRPTPRIRRLPAIPRSSAWRCCATGAGSAAMDSPCCPRLRGQSILTL